MGQGNGFFGQPPRPYEQPLEDRNHHLHFPPKWKAVSFTKRAGSFLNLSSNVISLLLETQKRGLE